MQENAGSVPSDGLPSFVRDPLGILRRRWRWMVLVLALGSIAAAGVVRGWPERYEATAKLRFSSQRIPENFVRSTLLEGLEEQLNQMVSEVLSRSQLIPLIEELRLDRGAGTLEALIAEVRESITVEPETALGGRGPGSNSLVIAIRYESNDPENAAEVANALADRFVTVHIKRREQQTRITSDFLRQELERAEKALHEQRTGVAEFKQRHRGELPSELGPALARLERLQQQRQSLATQISEAEGRLLLLSQEGAAENRLLAELRDRLAAERTVHTEEHPNVAALRAQLEALEADVSAADSGPPPQASAPVIIVRREIESLRAQLAATDREMSELDTRVARTPAREEELAGLEQREEVLRESYVQSLRKVQDAELSESLEQAQQGFRVSRLERAMPPTQPKLPRWQLAAGAAAAVIAASLALAVLLEWFDRVVVEARDLEVITDMMNLGEVPKMS